MNLKNELVDDINMFISSNRVSSETLNFLLNLKQKIIDGYEAPVGDKTKGVFDLESTLRSIGKKAFVDCFDVFRKEKYREIGTADVIAMMRSCGGAKSVDSARTKASIGKRIFKAGMEMEALKNIINSKKINEETKNKALLILQKEVNREVRRKIRDKTKYSFNGEVGLGKRGVVLSIWKKYMADNPNLSYEKLIQDFPSDIRNNLFVELEQALEQQKRDSNNITRYFIEEDEVLNIGEKTYTISNQWGKDNIDKFLEYARKLGYEIEEKNW